MGQDKRPVTGLSQDEFRVLDGGQEQTIVAFSEGEQSLDLILLFDISGSMRKQVRKIAAVAHEGMQELRQGDRVSVMVFNTDTQVIASFSGDLKVAEEAINRIVNLRFGGGTLIQDAVFYAARCFRADEDREHQRRALLVVTDDLGIPAHHKAEIVEGLWEADVLLSGLVVPNRAALKGLLAPLGSTRPGGIEDLVEQTGGDMIRSEDLSASFPEMMHRIRSRYTLYYKLPEAQVGSLRKIDVQLSPAACRRFPGARVVARHAYRLHEHDQYGFASH